MQREEMAYLFFGSPYGTHYLYGSAANQGSLRGKYYDKYIINITINTDTQVEVKEEEMFRERKRGAKRLRVRL